VKIVYEPMEQQDGFAIRRFIDDGRPSYVKKVYRGQYEFTSDHTYAKHFALVNAMSHIAILASRDLGDHPGTADYITVKVTRRNG
jgi:hypothetical protein